MGDPAASLRRLHADCPCCRIPREYSSIPWLPCNVPTRTWPYVECPATLATSCSSLVKEQRASSSLPVRHHVRIGHQRATHLRSRRRCGWKARDPQFVGYAPISGSVHARLCGQRIVRQRVFDDERCCVVSPRLPAGQHLGRSTLLVRTPPQLEREDQASRIHRVLLPPPPPLPRTLWTP